MTSCHHKKKILTVQTDNFEVAQGKLVASQVLSCGEWKFQVKPEFLINKHQVGLPRWGAVIKVNRAYLNMKIHWSFPWQESKEQRKWLTSVDVTNLNEQTDLTVAAILVSNKTRRTCFELSKICICLVNYIAYNSKQTSVLSYNKFQKVASKFCICSVKTIVHTY